ncbi:hypothetical protein NDU88_000598 [Pleurodeles waltl]|uniref:Uncharacterized protein n=1 Tax=Pleurodeles waltl TaxID=8319 RepID=A0AAV7TFX4_PLEWA|nr:hypothetical protein NDU88_000598 [Pleurodeles waltl]
MCVTADGRMQEFCDTQDLESFFDSWKHTLMENMLANHGKEHWTRKKRALTRKHQRELQPSRSRSPEPSERAPQCTAICQPSESALTCARLCALR